jgi:AraC-like DNA-binding protein
MDQFIFIILLCGAIQGTFLSIVYLFKKDGNKTADRILSLFLFLFSLSIALHALGHKGYIDFLPEHEPIVTVLITVYNPLIYLFIITETGKIKELKLVQAFHFIPAIIISLYLTYSHNTAAPATNTGTAGPEKILQDIIHSLIILQYLAYTFFSIREIIIYSRLVKRSSSVHLKNNMKWIGLFIGLNTFTWLTALIITAFSEISPAFIKNWDYVWLFAALYIYMIGYFALSREPAVKVDRRVITNKYGTSGLSPEKAEQIFLKLKDAMENQKVFLTEDLTLYALSNELDTSLHHLSQVINEKFRMNFSEYINRQRIEEAKRLIKSENNANIANIAFNVGFNSLSSFNSAFKKFTSITPSRYKNDLLTGKIKP